MRYLEEVAELVRGEKGIAVGSWAAGHHRHPHGAAARELFQGAARRDERLQGAQARRAVDTLVELFELRLDVLERHFARPELLAQALRQQPVVVRAAFGFGSGDVGACDRDPEVRCGLDDGGPVGRPHVRDDAIHVEQKRRVAAS